jgi:hypothetical protein
MLPRMADDDKLTAQQLHVLEWILPGFTDRHEAQPLPLPQGTRGPRSLAVPAGPPVLLWFEAGPDGLRAVHGRLFWVLEPSEGVGMGWNGQPWLS